MPPLRVVACSARFEETGAAHDRWAGRTACVPSAKDQLLMAENAGVMSIVTFSGPQRDTPFSPNLKEGLEASCAVTATKGMAWIVEGKLNYRDDGEKKG